MFFALIDWFMDTRAGQYAFGILVVALMIIGFMAKFYKVSECREAGFSLLYCMM